MGVHGLTTYISENSAAIAKTLQFASDINKDEPTTFVVDAWSFIYEVISWAGLPWVYGGEYDQFSEIVARVVKSWLGVGLRLYFVFDGPYPEIKFPTIISRVNKSTIQPSHLFFRTSVASRSTPRFLRESMMLPPGMYDACVGTLQKLARSAKPSQVLELHFADEEGDPYAVELAARLGGYVVGKDSDFVILNAEGYQGYVPLDLMVWSSLSSADNDVQDAEDDGFQTVVNSKAKKKANFAQGTSPRGIIPPEDDDGAGLQLTAITYSPASLSQHLQLPISLLPLLGALVGNDFTGAKDPSFSTTSQHTNLQWLFFERSLTLTQRIQRVANTLRGILTAALTPGASGKKQKNAVHSVMELIERAVHALIVRNLDTMASGEVVRVVERVVEATLQYAIPRYEGAVLGPEGMWADGVCALHDAQSCPLMRYISQPLNQDSLRQLETEKQEATRDRVRALYVAAYRAGRLDPHTLDVLHSGTFWYRQFLENPDLENVAKSIARPIQLWIYALLDDTLGLPSGSDVKQDKPEKSIDDEEDGGDEEDEDVLIDVVEYSDEDEVADPLAPLRGALQQLGGSDESTLDGRASEIHASVLSSSASQKAPIKIVEEYVRRGTRLAAEDIAVIPLSRLFSSLPDGVDQVHLTEGTPIQLKPSTERLTFLLRILRSDYHLLRSLPAEQRTAALALRWTAYQLQARAGEREGDKVREKERWTKQEAQAFLASFSFYSPAGSLEAEAIDPVPIVDRHVQLVAQVSVALDCVVRLSQVLLLDEELPSPVLRFSGQRFHAYLTRSRVYKPNTVPDRLWHACLEGLDHAFAEPAGKKKKQNRETGANKVTQTGKKSKSQGSFGGKFGLLADVDA
ncbi:hypothetical protein PHLGIDRAFT_83689 [Phlebiopsis gigantea 11061_1 CR5-6]|uniref:Peptidase C4 domain-containing protein n=1 Tax=Phlebiopsis gigantea (strain 11061_1 CR5-6) TaxID=745531 RepID=A0A0C3SCV7_PHLG1|nr:hypothetical protein PHLGIDRAFT_83689 [Phlebiopsis gigantea 11061_1 CR5-6]